MSRNHIVRCVRLCVAASALAMPFALVSGCGQKGPLYLPPRNGTVITRSPGTNTPQAQPAASPQTTSPRDKDKKDNSSQPPK
jgi:predicted small lipoprotein YifL